jgi:hypothetical protein
MKIEVESEEFLQIQQQLGLEREKNRILVEMLLNLKINAQAIISIYDSKRDLWK